MLLKQPRVIHKAAVSRSEKHVTIWIDLQVNYVLLLILSLKLKKNIDITISLRSERAVHHPEQVVGVAWASGFLKEKGQTK